MEQALVTVRNLACARGGLRVVEGVSFEVKPGDALVLRGPNGSGKTTLLRTLAGLQPPVHGEIAGQDDTFAYAGHADGLKATLSVEENLQFWAELFGQTDIKPAVESFELGALRGRLAGNLSAGQKRRLGLARLLVTGRRVWLLDEPTVSLDAATVALFAAAVRAHLSGGGATVIATHIDLGFEAREIDIGALRAAPQTDDLFDEAFS